MKSHIVFIQKFNSAFLCFSNGVAEMHHGFTAEKHDAKSRNAAIAKAEALQASVEEALDLTAPEGYVFAGIDEMSGHQSASAGFRAPSRSSNEERKTDARISKPDYFLFRLPTGFDATFVPAASEWTNEFSSPRGSGARVTQPHQLVAISEIN